jgi:hypothetical protein
VKEENGGRTGARSPSACGGKHEYTNHSLITGAHTHTGTLAHARTHAHTHTRARTHARTWTTTHMHTNKNIHTITNEEKATEDGGGNGIAQNFQTIGSTQHGRRDV